MRLTSAGWTVIAAGGVLLAAGVLLSYPELIALGAVGAAWIAVALAAVIVQPALRTERAVPHARVAEGEPVRCTLVASNSGRVTTAEVELVEQVAGRPFRVRVPPLPPGPSEAFEYDLPLPRRGVYQLPPPSIERSDPARLAYRRVSRGPDITVYVHPAFHNVPLFGAGSLLSSDGQATRPAGGGVAFYGLREYVPGDDRRLIHWPTSARLGSLTVRQHSVPDAPGYLVVLDTARRRYSDESFEDAVRISASLSVAVVRFGARLHLHTTGGTALPAAPPTPDAALGPALDFLAAVDLTDRTAVAGVGANPDLLGTALVTGEVGGSELASLVASLTVAGPVGVILVGPATRERLAVAGARVLSVRTSREFAERYRGLG